MNGPLDSSATACAVGIDFGADRSWSQSDPAVAAAAVSVVERELR